MFQAQFSVLWLIRLRLVETPSYLLVSNILGIQAQIYQIIKLKLFILYNN